MSCTQTWNTINHLWTTQEAKCCSWIGGCVVPLGHRGQSTIASLLLSFLNNVSCFCKVSCLRSQAQQITLCKYEDKTQINKNLDVSLLCKQMRTHRKSAMTQTPILIVPQNPKYNLAQSHKTKPTRWPHTLIANLLFWVTLITKER